MLNARTQQDHGLFWHCRESEYYWGRGNGFAAMGLAESLSYLPDDHPDRPAVLSMYHRLMESLRRLQHPSGLLAQVLDFPGSYLEFTATCMMGYAMARGLRAAGSLRNLNPDFRNAAELAWQGVSERIDDMGNVVDACASTGLQRNVRTISTGRLSSARRPQWRMALWFTTEMERLERGV